jgi:large subunit ribosomal protein L15
MPVGFEGGRQPLIRQLPKNRGFKSIDGKATTIRLSDLNKFADGDIVTGASLLSKGIIKAAGKVKIVGSKEGLKRKLTVKVPVSESVKTAITAAGGSVK